MGETSVKKTKIHSLSWFFKNSGCPLSFPVFWAGGRGLGTALITVPGGELVGLAGEIWPRWREPGESFTDLG